MFLEVTLRGKRGSSRFRGKIGSGCPTEILTSISCGVEGVHLHRSDYDTHSLSFLENTVVSYRDPFRSDFRSSYVEMIL